jgi:uncharacterized protein
MGEVTATLMLALLDSNIILSALLTSRGVPAKIVDEWLDGRFRVLTCRQQIDEIRFASRNPRFRERLQPHHIGIMLNHLYRADMWRDPIPRRLIAADPTDSYLLNLIEAAQPDYAVTGDTRSGLLQLDKVGRTKILRARTFCEQVLHL